MIMFGWKIENNIEWIIQNKVRWIENAIVLFKILR